MYSQYTSQSIAKPVYIWRDGYGWLGGLIKNRYHTRSLCCRYISTTYHPHPSMASMSNISGHSRCKLAICSSTGRIHKRLFSAYLLFEYFRPAKYISSIGTQRFWVTIEYIRIRMQYTIGYKLSETFTY